MSVRSWFGSVGTTVRTWAMRGLSWSLSGLTDEQARALGFSRPTLSGVSVTERSALESPEYFAGVRNISEDLATLPLILYKRLGERNRERDVDNPLYEILHDQPNEEMDSVQFVEMVQAWAMIRRNAYAEVQRTNGGRVAALWPIPPNRVRALRLDGEIVYRVDLPSGQTDPATGLPFSVLDRSRMFHLKAFTLDGVLGESSIDLHREAIGVALALDQYGGAFFGNDATPGGVYEIPQTLSDKAYERMKKELENPQRGLHNKHRIALLEEGTKFHEITTPNDKAQFIESKHYAAEQMARINRTPPHKIGELRRATFSNIEHQGIDYVVSSIRPHAVRWEKAIRTQLLTRQERRTLYAEFLLDALLRGDAKARADALAIERQNGIINGDEWRALNNMNEISDGSGKVYLVNGNMIPISEAGKSRGSGAEMRSPRKARRQSEQRPADPARVFAPLFRACAETCLRKESSAVAKAIDREFRGKGMKALEAWADQFYRDQEATVRRVFVPLAVSMGEAIRGAEGPDLGQWAQEYAGSVAQAQQKAAADSIRDVVAAGGPDIAGALRKAAESWASEEAVERMATREASAMVESLKRYLARNAGRAA